MMVTIGGLGFKCSGVSASSSSSSSAASSTPMNSTSKSNSLATSSITSASNRWFIETMMPRLIHLLITSAKLTSIKPASSLTEMNSVTCNLFPSTPAAPCCSAISSRLAFRYFAFRLFPLPPEPASFACVCFSFSCISFASITLSSLFAAAP